MIECLVWVFQRKSLCCHDDVIKWKHFPRYWPFVRGIHRSPVNSPHKGQWRGALMFSLICVRINGWVNNGEAGDLRRYRAHFDGTVMVIRPNCMRRPYSKDMMTSSNGNIFRVTGPLCGEFTPHKGQWRGALMFYLICTWINGWVNNTDTGDMRRHRAHYDIAIRDPQNDVV